MIVSVSSGQLIDANLCAAHATVLDDWADAYQQASAVVDQMTIEEKVFVVSGQTSTKIGYAGQIPGVPCLRFPGICGNDGPSGLMTSLVLTAILLPLLLVRHGTKRWPLNVVNSWAWSLK